MFKGAGTKSNMISAVYQGKGWTGKAIEHNSPEPSSQRTPIVTPHSLKEEEGQLGLGSLAVISAGCLKQGNPHVSTPESRPTRHLSTAQKGSALTASYRYTGATPCRIRYISTAQATHKYLHYIQENTYWAHTDVHIYSKRHTHIYMRTLIAWWKPSIQNCTYLHHSQQVLHASPVGNL